MSQAVRRDIIPLCLTAFMLIAEIPAVLEIGKPYNTETPSFALATLLLISASALWFWAEFITMLTNRKRRAVHDFIAGSVVVRLPQIETYVEPARCLS
jgi:hypothetical protein